MTWLWAIPLGIGALIGMVMFFEKRGAMKNRLGSAMAALFSKNITIPINAPIPSGIAHNQVISYPPASI
jgi:hypothetical protein